MIIYINHDLGLILAYHTTRSKVVTSAFPLEKEKTLDFKKVFSLCSDSRYIQTTV